MKIIIIKAAMILISALMITLSAQSFAGESDADYMKTADDFAACSGKYHALADYAKKENFPVEVVDNFSGNANGATLASAVMINLAKGQNKKIGEYTPYIDSIAHVHNQRIKVLLLDPNTKLEEILSNEMAICVELNPLQAKIANEMRKEIYLNK